MTQGKIKSFLDLPGSEKYKSGSSKYNPKHETTNSRVASLSASNLDLSRTPISNFPRDEFILFAKDKLYFLTKDHVPESGKKINIVGKDYGLIESESFLDLEKDYLKENKKGIDSFKSEYLKEVSEGNKIIKEKYNDLERSLRQEGSVSSLVRNYFFPITKGIDIEKIIEEDKKREENEKKIDIDKIKGIDLSQEPSYLRSFLQEKGSPPFLFAKGKCYQVSDSRFKVIHKIGDLEKKYKGFLKNKIKNKIRKSLDSYVNWLVEKDMSDLKEKVSSATSKPDSRFGADKISENEYVLFKKIGDYGVEWDGHFYLFPPVKVGICLIKTPWGYKIDEGVFVYNNPYYKHPFITGDKGDERREICTAGELGKIHKNINFVSSGGKKEKASLMKSAKSALDYFEDILKRGHNTTHRPMDSIPESAKQISKKEAEKLNQRGVEFFKKKYGD